MVKVGEKAPEFSNVAAYQKRSDFPKNFFYDYKDKWLVLFLPSRLYFYLSHGDKRIQPFRERIQKFELRNSSLLN